MFVRCRERFSVSGGEDSSAACEPRERDEGDHGHAESELQGLATGGGQSTVTGNTFESWIKLANYSKS